jgi:hypothetical protein
MKRVCVSIGVLLALAGSADKSSEFLCAECRTGIDSPVA